MITSDNVVLIEKNKKLRKTHEEAVRRANKSYIMELQTKLDKKDLQILQLIHIMKIATTEQLAKIVYKKNKFANKLMQKKMRKLFSYGCVDKFAPRKPMGEGSPQNHYVLARPGAKVLGIKNFKAIRKLNQKWRHTVAISDVFANLARKFTIYEWRLEMKLTYYVGANEKEIRPDCFVHLKTKDKDNYVFIEVDLGTENQEVLNKKIDAYHDYFFNSYDFMKADWQPYENQPIIIPIMFVLNDEKRLEKLKKYYLKFREKHSSKLGCYFTTFDKL